MAKKESRRNARIRAFRVLYGLKFSEVTSEDSLARAFLHAPDPKTAVDHTPPVPYDAEPQGYAWELTLGIWTKLKDLDEVVMRFSKHWRVERIANTDLAILRLALYEMLYGSDIPLKVSINEAIELAKQFGDENSRGFVNGILDAAARAIENGEIGIH